MTGLGMVLLGVVGYLVVSLATSRVAYVKQCFHKDGRRKTHSVSRTFRENGCKVTRGVTQDVAPWWAIGLFMFWPLAAAVALAYFVWTYGIYKPLVWFYTPTSVRKRKKAAA